MAGVTSIGVPIYGRTGQVLGAVSVSAITARMAERENMVVRIIKREVEALQAAQQQGAAARLGDGVERAENKRAPRGAKQP